MVSTFGYWEEQRKLLVSDLVANIEITASKDSINVALFGPVHTAMLDKAYSFIKQSMLAAVPISNRELILGSFKASLSVVLENLSTSLNISQELLKSSVQKFCAAALDALDVTIDDLERIDNWSMESNSKALDRLYGANFKKKFPGLAKQLPIQDKKIAAMAEDYLEQKIKNTNFGSNSAPVHEHLRYSKQIAPKIEVSVAFQAQFQQ